MLSDRSRRERAAIKRESSEGEDQAREDDIVDDRWPHQARHAALPSAVSLTVMPSHSRRRAQIFTLRKAQKSPPPASPSSSAPPG